VRVWVHGSGFMAQTVNVIIPSEDRERLLAIANDRSHRLKHIQCARIFLFSAERLPVLEVARRAGVSRPAVWGLMKPCRAITKAVGISLRAVQRLWDTHRLGARQRQHLGDDFGGERRTAGLARLVAQDTLHPFLAIALPPALVNPMSALVH
jgi:hypothetical protein